MKSSIDHHIHPCRTLLCATVISFMVLFMLPMAPENAQAAPGDVALVSSDAAGVQGNANSASSSISSDGRYVAFASIATNLVPGVNGNQI